MALPSALPQRSDHGDSLFQHFEALASRRPVQAGDVLVEILSGPESKKKSAGHHHS